MVGDLYNCTARPQATLLQPFLGQAPTPDQPSPHPRPAQPPPQTSQAPTPDQPSPHPRPAQLQVRHISLIAYNGRCDLIQTKENENASYTLGRTIWSENPMAEPSVNPMPLDHIPLQRQSSKHWPYLAFSTDDT